MTSAPTERTSERGTIVALDQLTSSVTNFVVVLVASRLFGASDFGAFAAVVERVQHRLGRGPYDQLGAPAARPPHRVRPAAFVPLSFLIALSALELGLLAIWLVTSSAGAAVWPIVAPVILLQDRMRYLALRVRPLCALASDGVWLVAAIAGWMVVRVDVLEALAAIRVVLVVGPVVGLAVLVLGLRGDVELVVEHDAVHDPHGARSSWTRGSCPRQCSWRCRASPRGIARGRRAGAPAVPDIPTVLLVGLRGPMGGSTGVYGDSPRTLADHDHDRIGRLRRRRDRRSGAVRAPRPAPGGLAHRTRCAGVERDWSGRSRTTRASSTSCDEHWVPVSSGLDPSSPWS